ncbi:heterokaryon incompatibility protein-domain-containing protein [Lasiosphaeria ovina]|uniref:Heterokaryon incompatibility protein-domain-containing protein n=1 Tax=Lasiosphaeria ovina TaxID=92902 RepID=A0AAE0MYR3_9PEZI|nr:heterokaryon incompatibility protein-domain-containing protein [Lasiosphaeria ovina]
MNPFEYKPLESATTIRVLVLGPSSDKDRSTLPSCRIVHIDRGSLWKIPGDDPETSTGFYEAVSYAWGDPDFSEELPIEDSSYLRITPTVKAMLCQFRHKSKTRRLWIDAVCLNQADDGEKAAQIPLMGDIYRQAAKVRIWLGSADPSTPHAIAALHSVAGRGTPPSTEMTASLDNFVKRPWFSRRWIVQEAAVSHARTVHCGPYKLSWEWMVDAFEELLASRGVVESPSPLAVVESNLWSTVTIRKRRSDIMALLWDFDKSTCSDPHDAIFTLMGLARNISDARATGWGDRGLTVPVAYDLSWVATYAHLARSLIRHGHASLLFNRLVAFGSLYKQNPSLPSWVPAWNRAREFTVPPVVFEFKYSRFASEYPFWNYRKMAKKMAVSF